MNKKPQLFLLIILLALALAACQDSVESDPDSCIIALEDLPLGSQDMTGTVYSEVTDEPFEGTLSAGKITFNDAIQVFAKYESSEEADALLTADAVEAYLGESAAALTDAPAVYGDKTIWAEIEDTYDSNAAVVRYGDYIMVASPRAPANVVTGMVDAFDQALLDYIDDNPACAYVHPDRR